MQKRRRYLLGLEPMFEGGWLHKGRRANRWNVEKELIGVALLGDVTIDLTNVMSWPPEVEIHAYALGRDVDVIVPEGTHVELDGRAHNDHLNDTAASMPMASAVHSVRITGHTLLGDVTTHVCATRA